MKPVNDTEWRKGMKKIGKYNSMYWGKRGRTLCPTCTLDPQAILTHIKDNYYTRAEVEEIKLKNQIQYLTLKAKYQRVFLGGDEDALITKRYVKKLRQRLARGKK